MTRGTFEATYSGTSFAGAKVHVIMSNTPDGVLISAVVDSPTLTAYESFAAPTRREAWAALATWAAACIDRIKAVKS